MTSSMVPAVMSADERDEYFMEERCHILELSNSGRDEALSVARARVAPGVTTALHRVRDTAERYLILSGRGEVEVQGIPPQTVGSGDVVLIPPGATQRIRNLGDEDLVFLALCTPRFQPENYEHLE